MNFENPSEDSLGAIWVPDFAPRDLPTLSNINLSPETQEHYVGVYGMAPGVNVIITLEGGHLVSQMTHQQKLPLTMVSANTFTPKVVDALLEFPKGEQGPQLNWCCIRMDAK